MFGNWSLFTCVYSAFGRFFVLRREARIEEFRITLVVFFFFPVSVFLIRAIFEWMFWFDLNGFEVEMHLSCFFLFLAFVLVLN